MHAHAHAHAHVHTHTHVHTQTYTNRCTHTRKHTHTHAHKLCTQVAYTLCNPEGEPALLIAFNTAHTSKVSTRGAFPAS